MPRLIILILFLITITITTSAFALDYPQPKYDIESKSVEEFVFEYYYELPVYFYKSNESFSFIERADANYETPEDAAISFLSSMSVGDLDWYIDSFDSATKKVASNQLEDTSFNEKLLSAWEKNFKGSDFVLVRRVDADDFIIIESSIISAYGESILRTQLVKEGDSWLVTWEHGADPIVNYFMDGTKKLRISSEDIKKQGCL